MMAQFALREIEYEQARDDFLSTTDYYSKLEEERTEKFIQEVGLKL